MRQKPELLFFVVGAGKYRRYINPYIVCALESNPDACVEVLTDDLHEVSFEANRVYPDRVRYHKIEPGVPAKHARWLTRPRTEAELTYIGDIDIAITDAHIYEWHKRNMERLGLPYSNVRRGESPERLTGLHCVRSDVWYEFEWYKITTFLKAGKLKVKTGNDERMLASMAIDIVGKWPPVWENPSVTDSHRPQHGIHFSGHRKRDGRLGWGDTPERIEALKKIQETPAWKTLCKDNEVFSLDKHI